MPADAAQAAQPLSGERAVIMWPAFSLPAEASLGFGFSKSGLTGRSAGLWRLRLRRGNGIHRPEQPQIPSQGQIKSLWRMVATSENDRLLGRRVGNIADGRAFSSGRRITLRGSPGAAFATGVPRA